MDLKSWMAEHETGWRPGWVHLPKLIRERGLMLGAEIGVAFGGHSEAILSQPSVRTLYGVDSYLSRTTYVDRLNISQADFDQMRAHATQRLAPFGDRFQQLLMASQAAVSVVPDGLDFVYIDAEHSYEAAKADLAAWVPKVRNGGIASGHDYDYFEFPGVRQAVDEHFAALGLAVQLPGDTVWYVEMKR